MDTFKSLKDHVYQYISEKINDGTLLPETKINEKMVIDDLDISRTPVREAMIQLAAEGFLEKMPRKGFVVKQVDKTKAKEVYSLLGVLEGFAAVQAVDKITPADLDEMRSLYARMEEALASDDMRTYYALQNQFHDTFVQKSGNQELTRVIRQLKKIFIRQSYVNNEGPVDLKENLKTTNEDHNYIIELFEKKSGKVLEQHLRDYHWHPQNAEYDVF